MKHSITMNEDELKQLLASTYSVKPEGITITHYPEQQDGPYYSPARMNVKVESDEPIILHIPAKGKELACDLETA